jgi:homeobox protein cut-like
MDLSYSYLSFLGQNTDQKHVFSDQDQSSMLKVICNQRNRFRARLSETEEVFILSFEKIHFWFPIFI